MSGLQTLLRDVLSGAPHRSHVQSYVAHCHSIAVAYIWRRIKSGRLQYRFVPGSVDQFALDSIADLFERDEQGRFTQLLTYYEDLDWKQADEQRLLTETRRLVFSQVNDALFRRYRELDPSLSRIIRGIKRAVRDNKAVTLERHGSSSWIVFSARPEKESDEMVPEPVLEYHLRNWLRASDALTDLVRSLADYLAGVKGFAPRYRLVDFAVAVRETQTYLQVADTQDPLVWDNGSAKVFSKLDVTTTIARATTRVRTELHETYVGKKTDEATFTRCLSAAADIMRSHYLEGELNGLTRHEVATRHFDGMSKRSYRENVRNMLDYVVRKMRAEVIGQLSREP